MVDSLSDFNKQLFITVLLLLLGGKTGFAFSFLPGKIFCSDPLDFRPAHRSQSLVVEQTRTMNIGTDEQPEPQWCSQQKIYLNGVVPRAESAFDVSELLQPGDDENENKCLRIFGYGSLCWRPGSGVLSKETVRRSLGRAVGWRRCWAQRSADHRGTPMFPGLVCTLLKDEEVQQLKKQYYPSAKSTAHIVGGRENFAIDTKVTSMTEGLIYTIPSELVDECLEELVCRIIQSHGGALFE
jgi:cation transport regulator ChaC